MPKKSDRGVERTREEDLLNFHGNQSLPEAIPEVDYCVLRKTRARGGACKKERTKSLNWLDSSDSESLIFWDNILSQNELIA